MVNGVEDDIREINILLEKRTLARPFGLDGEGGRKRHVDPGTRSPRGCQSGSRMPGAQLTSQSELRDSQ